MSRRPRHNHSPAFKAKLGLAAIKVEKALHTKIGELTLVNDFLQGALGKAGLLPSAKR